MNERRRWSIRQMERPTEYVGHLKEIDYRQPRIPVILELLIVSNLINLALIT